jgi:hypothetical protein
MLLKKAIETRKALWYLALVAGIAAVFVLTEIVPTHIPGFDIDYGFWGVMLPVCVYAAKDRRLRLAATALCLALVSYDYGWIQWFCLGAVPLLALYNGQPGRKGLKYGFYIFYPAHLVVLWVIAAILEWM